MEQEQIDQEMLRLIEQQPEITNKELALSLQFQRMWLKKNLKTFQTKTKDPDRLILQTNVVQAVFFVSLNRHIN